MCVCKTLFTRFFLLAGIFLTALPAYAVWTDISSESQVTLNQHYFNRVARATTAHIAVTVPDPGQPLRLVLENPSPSVLNADGVTESGQPYINLAASQFNGTNSATVSVNFALTRRAPSFTGIIEQDVLEVPLTLNAIGDLSVPLGSSLNITLAASGTNAETATFDIAPLPLPANASLNPQSGAFSFTPKADQVGAYTLTFSVSDGTTTDSQTVALTVEPPDANGVTELTGRILDANAFETGATVPLSGVVVSMLGTNASDTTDAQGNFKLSAIPDGIQVLDLNATNATSSNNSAYAGFRESIELIANVNNNISRPFFLPQLEGDSLTPVNPTQTTVVNNERLGVSLTVPPNTARDALGNLFTGSLSISEVPPALAPAPLPPAFRPGLLITIQPVGVRFDTPVPITFPNIDGLPAGSEVDIWSIDPDSGTFIIVGVGQVSADESVIETISGGIIAADWHFPSPENPDGSTDNDDQSNDNDGNNNDCPVGSSASVSGGCLKVSHNLAPYQSLGESRGLRFTYNSESAAPFPVATVESSISSRTAIPVAFRAKLNSVGGIQTDKEQFVTATRESMRHAVQFEASKYPTGQYPYEIEVSSEYQRTGISTILKDFVLINNEMNSPFGAGWTLEGLQRLHTVAGSERATLSEGTGAIKTFIPQGAVGEQPTDLAFLFDGSGSVRGSDFTLQLEGVAAALENPLTIPHDGSVSLVIIQFAGIRAFTEVALTNIDSQATAFQVANQIRSIVQRRSGTPITAGVNQAVTELTQAGRDDARKVIFVSTDGQPNSQAAAVQAANNAVASGIDEISAIGIGPGANLAFLDGFVRNGSVFSAANFSQFAASIGEKLRIIVGGSPAGEFSFIIKRDDNTFLRRLKTGEQIIFNAAGYQTAMIDRNNNETRYEYDGQNRLIRMVDPVGLVTSFAYDNGVLSTVTDPAGRVTSFTHANGNLTSITDPDGTVRRFEYNGHLLTKQFDKKNQATSYTYDHQNRFIASARPDNTTRGLIPSKTKALVASASSKEAPAPGTLVSESVSEFTNGNGEVTRFVTDKLGNVSRTTDALGRVTIMERDDNGLVTKRTEPNGNVTEYTYDDRGNLLTTRRAFDGGTTTITYDPSFSLPLTLTDARGNTTTMVRDSRGNITQIINALGHVTEISYNTQGLVTQLISPNGLVTDYAYNAQGLLQTATETPPQNGGLTRITQYSYDAIGNVIQSISPQGVVVDYAYDALNRIIELSNQQGERIRYDYDAHGNQTLVESVDPDGSLAARMEMDFDELHRLNRIARPHQNTTESIMDYERDGDGNIVTHSDPNQDETQYVYDAVNKVIQNIDALGGITDYQYNANDVITQVTAPNSATTNYALDLLDRTVTENSPDRGTVNYVYDLNHNITQITDGRNITSSYTYDALDRVTNVTYPNAAENVTFVYDNCAFGLGRVCERHDESGVYLYVYDAYGNVLEENYTIDNVAYSKAYSYDADHNVVAITYPAGRVVNYTRDNLNRITAISADINGTGSNIVSNITYRADGKIDGLTYGNGLTENRALDLQARLLEQSIAGVDIINYAYDPDSNLLNKGSANDNNLYSYDALDRVIGDNFNSSVIDFTYDPSDNRTSQQNSGNLLSYTIANGSNRLNLVGSTTLIYDNAGNLIRDTLGRLLTYNNAGRLESISDANGALADYIYDANGLRRKKVTSTETVIYHYDHYGQLIAETTLAGATQRDYIWLENMIYAQVDSNTSGDNITYLHCDHLYTPRIGTDNTGQVVWRWESDAFGSSSPTGTKTVNLRFPGQYFDEESGLHYNWNRYYDPKLGRYLQSDPNGLADGLNTYAYVGGNPINFYDPFGLAKLPNDPSGLGDGWSQDHGHKNPNGEKWDHESGTSVEWHPGQPGKPGWGGKDHWHVNGGKEHLPPGTDVPDFPGNDEEEEGDQCGEDSVCRKVATTAVVGGTLYVIYRCARMVPSLFPPLWPTIPANAAIP